MLVFDDSLLALDEGVLVFDDGVLAFDEHWLPFDADVLVFDEFLLVFASGRLAFDGERHGVRSEWLAPREAEPNDHERRTDLLTERAGESHRNHDAHDPALDAPGVLAADGAAGALHEVRGAAPPMDQGDHPRDGGRDDTTTGRRARGFARVGGGPRRRRRGTDAQPAPPAPVAPPPLPVAPGGAPRRDANEAHARGVWERVPIYPGVELHVRLDANPKARKLAMTIEETFAKSTRGGTEGA